MITIGLMEANSYEALVRRRDAGTLTWPGPALMLLARAAFAVGAQALVAAVFALWSSPNPWHDAEPWLPVYGTLIDAGCLALLWQFTRREGIRLFDLIGLERMRLSLPLSPFVDRLHDRHLHHRVRIFGGGIGMDIAMPVMADRRLGRPVEIAQRPFGAAGPVAKVGRGPVDERIGAADHLQKLPRAVALILREIRTKDERRVRENDFAFRWQWTHIVGAMGIRRWE